MNRTHGTESDLSLLEVEGPDVLRRMRHDVAALLASAGWNGGSSADLARRLGLDRSLAWKVWSVAEGDTAVPSPQHVPGQAGFAKFLESCAVAGADAGSVATARETFEHYRRLGRQHAGDRASADILLGSLSGEGRRRQDLALRRGLFRGNVHVLGVRASMLYQCTAVFPGRDGFHPDVALVRGVFGLGFARPGVAWILGRSTLVQSGGADRMPVRRAMDASIAEDRTPLLREFCRPGSVEVCRAVVDGRTVQDELSARPMGRAGEVDVVTGEVVTDIPADDEARDAVTMAMRTPAEWACFDVLLHEAVVEEGVPELACHSLMNREFPFREPGGGDLVPITESLIDLGSGEGVPILAEVGSHAGLLSRIVLATGRSAREFRAYRVRLRYPPLPCCVAVTYRLRRV